MSSKRFSNLSGFLLVFSQNKASKMVADISVSGTKLHVSYSDGTSKDMDMPPATSLRLPVHNSGGSGWWYDETPNDYVDFNALYVSRFGASLEGKWHSQGRTIVFNGKW